IKSMPLPLTRSLVMAKIRPILVQGLFSEFVCQRCYMRLVSRCFTVAILALAAFPQLAISQVQTGRLEGTVSDPQGAAVPGAQVKVVNGSTGQTFNVDTDEKGYWALPSLTTSLYKVTVTRQGFKTAAVDNVKVDAGVPSTVN